MKKSFLLGSLASLCLIPTAMSAILSGVTSDNMFVFFDTSAPGSLLSSAQITGLVDFNGVADPFAAIVNLTYHYDTGKFYGIDSNANFYEVATSGSTILLNNTFAPSGFSGGLSYDPFSGNLVFGSIDSEHFTLNTAGAATLNPNFIYAPEDGNHLLNPSVFTLGIDPITGEAFFLDNATGTLAQSFDPAHSELFTVGNLGFAVTSFGGMVVDEDGNLFAALSTDSNNSSLYSINKATGAASLLGSFSGGISTLAIPEPSAALLGGIGMLALLRRRRA